ncbi:MAG: alanine racemase [Bombella apis]|nr:alanine racemase [Bombella apis]
MRRPRVRGLCEHKSARLKVDLSAIRKNYARLSRYAVGADCAAVVKADAYGLGMDKIATALAGQVKSFFVAQPEEGCLLRKILPNKRIFVLHGFLPDGPGLMADYNLIPVLNSLEQVRGWRAFCSRKGRDYPAALQFDTGMSRFGLAEEDIQNEALKGFKPILVMSHLACADHLDHPANEEQRKRFIKMSAAFPHVPRSLAASSGIFLGTDYHFDLVRPGVALYGLPPNEMDTSLHPVLELEAQILQLRKISKGAGVGYGLSYHATHSMRLATVGIGYADGVFRAFSEGGGHLWYKGIRLPIIGRVSMDSLTVDVTAVPEEQLAEGSWLSVIGPEQDIATVAAQSGTIGYEILTSLGHRFARFYHDDDDDI